MARVHHPSLPPSLHGSCVLSWVSCSEGPGAVREACTLCQRLSGRPPEYCLEVSGGPWGTLEVSGGPWGTLEDPGGAMRYLEDPGGAMRYLEVP